MNFQGLIKNNVEFPGMIKKKPWNLPGPWFKAIKFPRSIIIQFFRVSRGEALVCLEFLGVK